MNKSTIQSLFAAALVAAAVCASAQSFLEVADATLDAVRESNEQVKRNGDRFPERFMFRLTPEEVASLRSQFATSNGGAESGTTALRSQFATSKRGGTRYLPYAFTEHGVIMLASVLNSPTAVRASVKITDAFVAMRRAIASIAPLLARIEATDRRQIADQLRNDANQARNEERFKLILDAMQNKKFPPQKVFFDGQIYDAFEQMKKFVRMAKSELVVIDPYFDDSVLPLVAQKRTGVSVVVVKNSRNTNLHAVDVARFNAQYANTLAVKTSDKFHDRFLVIDRTALIHVGASLNYLGKRCFAFATLDKSNIPDILAKI